MKLLIEKSVAEEIKKKLESYKQVKNEEKDNINDEFAENLQKSNLYSENKQVSVKFQGSKNIFNRGDFDEYKISDEELKDHANRHYFSRSELIKRGERLSKIYEKICRDTGLSMSEVVNRYGITDDDCYYDLDNPTEKFYYDLKMKFAKNDKTDDIEKTLFSINWDEIIKSHKYSRKEFKNGKWIYYYDKHNNYGRITRCNEPKLNILVDKRLDSEEQSVMIADQAIDYIENVWLKDWEQHPEKAICKELCGKKIHFSDLSYEHIWKQGGNSDSGAKLREPSNILSHVKYLPMAKEIIESNGVWTNARYEKLNKPFLDKKNNKVVDAVIYQTLTGLNSDTNSKYPYVNVKITRRKYKDGSYDNDVYISVDAEKKIKKSMDFSPCPIISKSVNDKVASIGLVRKPKCHADNSNIPQQNNLSSKNVTKSLTYSGYKLQGRTKLYGMDISIENKKGTYRSGVDSDGHKWKTLMHYDYGYIRGTVGTDSDFVDCYIGPDKNAKKVYVIHQNNPVTHKYDEDKCMLCFENAEAAKKAYMKQYDRPVFFGSMETLTVEQFKSFVFSKQGSRIHKSFDVCITDITENNKQKKYEQLEKSLNAIYENKPFVIKHIKADTVSTRYDNLYLRFTNFDKEKIEKALHKVALSLDAKMKTTRGEKFLYKSEEQLTDKFFQEMTKKTMQIYSFVIKYFDLPDIRIVSKANLQWKGKVIYNPETGKPITKAVWDKFIVELEKFLNRNYSGIGKKIVLSAESLGIILERLSKTSSFESIKKMPLSELKVKRKDIDWISESVQNMKNSFGESITRDRAARIQVAVDSAAQRVTRVKDEIKNQIQQIIIDGIRDKQSKSVVAQKLFDKCASLNRDMQRIADTEIQEAKNSAYVLESVYNTAPNEKVYFERYEIVDDNTCKECQKLKGAIALWSDVPLPNERIKDTYAKYAIWDGKVSGDAPIGVKHPWCRGAWVRIYPDLL